ncbi:histidine phosphatase family protein [bacterium]|nr:histidine phosphatase family protein [bacterium]
MSIYLIRHGQSEGNAQGVYQGTRDYPLSNLGCQQAAVLGSWLAERGVLPAAVYTSPLLRAQMTAEEIAAGLCIDEPVIRDELREFALGDLEGRTPDEAAAIYPDLRGQSLAQRGDFSPYGGESREEMRTRLGEFIAFVTENHQADDIVAVSHGGSLYQLLCLWCGWPAPEHFFMRMSNCSCYKLKLREISGQRVAEMQWFATLEIIAPELA